MEEEKENLNWIDYERIVNGEFEDIIMTKYSLANLLRGKKKSIRLKKYQIEFIQAKFPKGNLSQAIRTIIDELIILQNKENKEKTQEKP